MGRRSRLDAELVRRGLARSREHAVTLIAEGRVAVSGQAATKAATGVEAGTPVVVRTDPDQPSWVSRGAHKLLGALDAFGVPVEGRRTLDAGASTGGFTEVLLSRGATEVVAVDVGYGELAWSLRTDDRVRVHERTNVRTLTPEVIDGPVDLVVADLSFISLKLVLPALSAFAGEGAIGSTGCRPCSRSRAPLRHSLGVRPVWWRARCRGRLGTWSSSCGCGAMPARSGTTTSVEQSRRVPSDRARERDGRHRRPAGAPARPAHGAHGTAGHRRQS